MAASKFTFLFLIANKFIAKIESSLFLKLNDHIKKLRNSVYDKPVYVKSGSLFIEKMLIKTSWK